MTRLPARTRSAALLVTLLGSTGLGVVAAGGASAAPATGYVRLAHLSPDTPAVDVSLTSFRGRSFNKELDSVSYGTVSDYQRVQAGTYTVSMWKPGASHAAQPLLTTNVQVTAGKSYTVAGVGPTKQLALRVLPDDLTPPAPGKARVRVIEASATRPAVDVTTAEGVDIAKDATFPSTTAYREVDARSWDLRVTPTSGASSGIARTVDLKAGTVYSFVVLDTKAGDLDLTVRSDAAGTSAVPQGAVAAGYGGAAPRGGAGADRTAVVLLTGLLAGGGLLAVRRVPARAPRRTLG